jgi:hypothetical protein
METHLEIQKIRECTQNLLTCDNNFLIMKQSVDMLFSIFSEITGVSGDNFNYQQIMLPTGKAISPSSAAFCLLELRRTTIFYRGINKAIQKKLSEKKKDPVRILYAGTGPYATLILPLLTLYNPDDVKVDLLDINEISLNSAILLFKNIGLDPFISKTFLSDATKFILEVPYDIVVSETMQAALKKEPQVAVMQNLIPQMTKNAIFIPEAIKVRASLLSFGHWDDKVASYTGIEIFAGKDLFTVDKNHLITETYHNELNFPPIDGANIKLQLDTEISVFDNEVLKDGDCSLTLPLKVCTFKSHPEGKICFWYEQGTFPGIRCQFDGSDEIYEALGKKLWNETNPNQFTV